MKIFIIHSNISSHCSRLLKRGLLRGEPIQNPQAHKIFCILKWNLATANKGEEVKLATIYRLVYFMFTVYRHLAADFQKKNPLVTTNTSTIVRRHGNNLRGCIQISVYAFWILLFFFLCFVGNSMACGITHLSIFGPQCTHNFGFCLCE